MGVQMRFGGRARTPNQWRTRTENTMPHSWNQERSETRILSRYDEVEEVKISNYTRETSLDNIPVHRAYLLHGAHIYLDLQNFDEILATTDVDGETSHKRALRFLNLHYRAVHRILAETGAIRVDFHNQRLHAVVAKPYGADTARDRIIRAVAIADLIQQVLQVTGDSDEKVPNAQVRVGIDSGKALVVNNGRRGAREPLFLGTPANRAAKFAAGTGTGIYLTNDARVAIGLRSLSKDLDRETPLTAAEIAACHDEAELEVTTDSIVKAWQQEQKDTPIGSISFSRPTPPASNLDIDALTLSNSKRFDGISIYADIDGFSEYVSTHIESNPEDVVRTLHVLRSELDAALSSDFAGCRVRFIGDCIHGLMVEGTAYTTNEESTLSNAVMCAGALRSGFNTAQSVLKRKRVAAGSLGLAIGFEFGWESATSLGMRQERIRCAMGRGVLASEGRQRVCTGTQTAIGDVAYRKANLAIQDLFGKAQIVENLDYDAAVTALAAGDDKEAKLVESLARQAAVPTVVQTPALRPYFGKR